MRVAVGQVSLQVGDLEGNRARSIDAVLAAVADGADLVVLPELSDSGYVFGSYEEASSLGAPILGNPTLQRWGELANQHRITIVGGFAELGEDGALYNSAALIAPDQNPLTYRKIHLWDGEKEFFTPGDALSTVTEVNGVRVGLAICYDLEFPELVRALTLMGVELLVVPTNWPLSPVPQAERPVEFVKAQASAATNGIWIAIADRCGKERGVDWVGYSSLLDPSGYPAFAPIPFGVAGVAVGEVDPARARNKVISSKNHLLDDRRSDLYRVLARSVSTAQVWDDGDPPPW
ncbi:nitrilase-related carbon-nitrogen hydrolase [Ferrimicrobium sp.]|uniref:nitrilase-related carbon-nitrogen hydrolase n=1 Tax=Ferrimicrobium sp. TaxID=2926050 RepID=UPI002617DDEE|nr:nitrilase-related carbon-nitrogen hydrolase [Ferrimicrobium sp.]